MSIRLKLIAALAPPLLALAAVTGLEVVWTLEEVRDVREQTALVEASLGPLNLFDALQRERNAASIYLLGLEGAVTLTVEDNGEARAQTDAAAEQLRSGIDQLDESFQALYEPGFESLEQLDEVRRQVDEYALPRTVADVELPTEVFERYTEVTVELYAANVQVALAITDPWIHQGAELALVSSQAGDLVARIVRDLMLAEIGGPAPDGLNDRSELVSVGTLLSQLRNSHAQLRAAGEGGYQSHVEELLEAPEIAQFPDLVARTIESGEVDLGEVLTTATGEGEGDSPLTVFRQKVAKTMQDEARRHEERATTEAQRMGALAVGATALALLAAVLVAWSISRPLKALTRQSKHMALHRLPGAVRSILEAPLGQDVHVADVEPVRVRARHEVQDVADALTTVQGTAVDLAVEQAVLRRNVADSFLSMGRRNQNLLARQLEFITELESGESDPQTLANLFRLDHLATRMRRNAESLLVLAGVEAPRRWSTPVPTGDLVRSATGEVEEFQRVTAQNIARAAVVGSAATDLAHVLAELIENALTHSPPDRGVDVRGALAGPEYRGYRFAVIDNGLGMPPVEMEAANRRLGGAEYFTVAPSRYLGHYVAGNLAARHGVRVWLEPTPSGGVTAVVDLPPDLIVPMLDGAVRTNGLPRPASGLVARAGVQPSRR